MALKISGKKGSTATKAKPKAPAKAKPAARGRKTAAAPAKRTPRAAAKTTTTANGRTRRPTTDDQKVINRHIKLLQKAGERREATEIAHKEAVEAVYEATRQAMEDGVPTGVITDYSGISRQWLYKMGAHQGREEVANGSSPAKRKPAARKATTAKAPAKKAGKLKIRAR